MVESGIWEIAKAILQFVAAPLIGFLVWLHKKQDGRIEHLEDRLNVNEKQVAVIEAKLDHISKSIEKIEKGVEKLVDRRNGER